MQPGMTPEQVALMRLKHRIRWSCMLHNVRDDAGEHERRLLEEYMPPHMGPEHELYTIMYGIFESMHKYCKKLLKDGLTVSSPPPPLTSNPHDTDHVNRLIPIASSSCLKVGSLERPHFRINGVAYAQPLMTSSAKKTSLRSIHI